MTLRRLFVLALLVLAGLLGGLIFLLLGATRQSIVNAADAQRAAASAKLVARVDGQLSQAEEAVTGLADDLLRGVIGADAAAREASVFATMLHHRDLTEAALTDDGGQVAVLRIDERLETRWSHREGDRWVTDVRRRPKDGDLLGAPFERDPADAADPTQNLTYVTPRSPDFLGRPLWSDLAFVAADDRLPEAQRRLGVSLQRGVVDAAGRFRGVVRAGVWSNALDEVRTARVREDDTRDPHRAFVCDRAGRLITRLAVGDAYGTVDAEGRPDADGEDLRVVTPPPPAVAAALALPAVREARSGPAVARFDAGGEPHLVTFTAIRGRDWVLGIVVPEAYYLAGLAAQRSRLLAGTGAAVLAVLAAGAFALGRVRRDFSRIAGETRRMQRFEFGAVDARSAFRDVAAVEESLEQAKTALRALGKYVPVPLVRQLYEARREPALGGELQEATLLFSDIEGFTSSCETLAPDVLARALGRYLAVMSEAVHATGGTIDKFIGDSVMAMWNAPNPQPDHARRACRAALACLEATERLFASPEWEGLPRWRTRIGIHTGRVMVGHFGAPDRISYTAIGDGVNLASRLEGQNKSYGTSILVSEDVVRAAGDGFELRRVDRVAVRGKTEAVDVYELVRAAS